MITYALIDPTEWVPRYIGRTIRPVERLKQHKREAWKGRYPFPLITKECWLGCLNRRRVSVVMVQLAEGDFEYLFYSAFKALGIRMTNKGWPPKRLLLTYQPTFPTGA